MPYGLYLSAEGAHAQATRLEVIANNLANVDTPGFKRQLALFQARYSEAVDQGVAEPGSGELSDISGGIRVIGTAIDLSQGPIKQTGVQTDLAIDGDGFFMLEKDGQRFLTRAGNFTLLPNGQLVAQRGGQTFAVLDEAGAPIFVDPEAGPWEITSTGTIRQGGAAQNIAVVRPADPATLQPVGYTLYKTDAPLEIIPLDQRRVLAGHLEMSAVNPTLEMIELIETTRAIEANLNLVQTQDELFADLITRVMRS